MSWETIGELALKVAVWCYRNRGAIRTDAGKVHAALDQLKGVYHDVKPVLLPKGETIIPLDVQRQLVGGPLLPHRYLSYLGPVQPPKKTVWQRVRGWFTNRSVGAMVFLLLSASVVASAQPAPVTESPLSTFGFDAGLSLRWIPWGPQVVSAATIDANGVVRCVTCQRAFANLTGTAHVLPWKNAANTFGVGPFVGAELAGSGLSAVGAGLLFDWKVAASKGFGLGVGYAVLPNVTNVGQQFQLDKPAPVGPDGKPLPISTYTTDRGSVWLVFVVSF